MAYIYRRGGQWWGGYTRPDGKRIQLPTRKPTAPLARRFVADEEARAWGNLPPAKVEEPQPQTRRETPTNLCKDLLGEWMESLDNRNAKEDLSAAKRYLVPKFGHLMIEEVTVPELLLWITELKKLYVTRGKKKFISSSTQRHAVNLLGRFFAWAILNGHAVSNPVAQLPQRARPSGKPEKKRNWIRDDDARQIFRELLTLNPAAAYMFYVGNRAALREGEIAGLRMSDVSAQWTDWIRVRGQWDDLRPCKEMKDGGEKWPPRPTDFEKVMGPWLKRRSAEGAKDESLVFPCSTRGGRCFNKKFFSTMMKKMKKALSAKGIELPPGLTWHQATRDSYVTRNSEKGGSIEEASRACNHSSTTVTKKFYDMSDRRVYSPLYREGLFGTGGGVVPLKKRSTSNEATTKAGQATP